MYICFYVLFGNIFQSWLESYCREWQSDTFSWIARNAKVGNAVNGATLVMLSTILNRNITIVSYTEPYVWQTLTNQLYLLTSEARSSSWQR